MVSGYAALLCGSLLSAALLEQSGLMKHGDHIGIGTQKKLGHLLLGPYSRFISILEQIRIWKNEFNKYNHRTA
ncbi:hypothetical protein SADUNF_Sadunf16G0000800 [Salix dunnii]|uniref:Uncharacterized protein n=1 Tax=Salix dunnii TaxID=1413687 RepID=A0A835J2V0_9ROSI|nr:hypothetical protein SADUNF_SadunfPtG0005500 [Salix dunnii]KAF9664280.1 hypothetical protein SADUNF_Sadunf16G0000800 [Salix dunnii]